MDGRQLLQGGVALGLPLHVLGGDGVQGSVGDGVAGLVDHIGPAVIADLDGGDDVVEEGLRRHEVDHAHDPGAPAALVIDGRGHHDGQLPGNLADQGLGHVDAAAHSLLDVLPVGVVLPVKDAHAVQADNVAPLEAVHPDPLVNDGPLFLHRHGGVRQLGNAPGVHRHVLVGGQLLLDALRRQHGGFAEHPVHCGDGAAVCKGDTDGSHRDHGDHDRRDQAYGDFFADTFHLFAPQ